MSELELGPLHFGIIGAGRLGLALGKSLQTTGFDVVHVAARSEASRDRATHELGVPAHEDLLAATESVDCVVICVPDDEVDAVVQALVARPADASPIRLRIVSTSAVGGLAALMPLAAMGHEVCVLHPMATFTAIEGNPEPLRGAGAAVGATDDATRTFAHALAHTFGLVPFDLEESDWGAHAAACSAASNLVVTALSLSAELADSVGLHESVARNAYARLAAAAVDRFARGERAGGAGPVARGDVRAIERQVAAVHERAPGADEFFRASLDAAIRRSFAAGSIDMETARRLGHATRGSEGEPKQPDSGE